MTDFTNFAAERPNYFPGQYLLEDEFELQHKYLSDRQKYHHHSLHVSGIIEGLEVESIPNRKAVRIKPGSAINNHGQLIVLKDNITFSDFQNFSESKLYIRYFEDKQVKQQDNVADSYTRWIENPKVEVMGLLAATPDDSVELARCQISGNTVSLSVKYREYSGLSLPNPHSKALTLRSGGDTDPNSAILTGSLKIDNSLTVADDIIIGTPDIMFPSGRGPKLYVQGSQYIKGDLTVNGTVQLGKFTDQDRDEWPYVTWYKNTAKNWDEGLIKHKSSRGVFKRAGYGIHFHESREFGFWSSHWQPLFAVEGKTGNTYIKGNLTVKGKGEIEQEEWRTANLENNWKNLHERVHNLAAYFKDSLGIVHLQGSIINGKDNIKDLIFRLPDGYRPLRRESLAIPIYLDTLLKIGLILILYDGRVYVKKNRRENVENGIIAHLDGITFRATQ